MSKYIGMFIKSIERALHQCFFHIQYVLCTAYPPLGDWGTLLYLSAQSIFHSYHMQVFFVLKFGGGIGIRGSWAKGFMVYNRLTNCLCFI